jgi:hypothetical protein
VWGNIDENGTAVETFGKYADDGTIALLSQTLLRKIQSRPT